MSAFLVGLAIVCCSLVVVTKWALDFSADVHARNAASATAAESAEPIPEKKAPDPAVVGIVHLKDWDEFEVDGKRYRKETRNGGQTYEYIGFFHYPSGIPTDNSKVRREYRRRLSVDMEQQAAIKARKEWGIES